MSHIVTIKTEIRDEQAVKAACSRLKWEEPVFTRYRLFSSSKDAHHPSFF